MSSIIIVYLYRQKRSNIAAQACLESTTQRLCEELREKLALQMEQAQSLAHALEAVGCSWVVIAIVGVRRVRIADTTIVVTIRIALEIVNNIVGGMERIIIVVVIVNRNHSRNNK